MVGYAIYLIFCQHGDGKNFLVTPHATFDGAFEHMKQILKFWEDEKGFNVIPEAGGGGGFYVNGPNNLNRYYYIVTRTIEQ